MRRVRERARALTRRAMAARRRGNFFILVVGTLAMLAVITVIYVAVGKSDRRTGTAVQRARDAQDVVGQVRDHMLDVIARDLFTPYSPPDGTELREAWDIPSTDPFTTVYRPNELGLDPARFRPFDPAGAGDDPWLAATEPTYLGLGTNDEENPSARLRYQNFRDWKHISNFAPTGLFVNLVNLRGTTSGGTSQGNFRAPPGFGGSAGAGWRMSDRLSLWDADDAPVFEGENDGLVFPAEPYDLRGGTASELAHPRDWTADQRLAFRPMADSRYEFGDPAHIDNQWADADGDGMADSRWFELVASDTGRDVRYLLSPSDGLRYFIAARAIDLSALVNVNTAADFVNGPDAGTRLPAGLTPASVDLRRLLGLSDAAFLWNNDDGDRLSYADLWPGSDPDGPDLAQRVEEDYRFFDQPGRAIAPADFYGVFNPQSLIGYDNGLAPGAIGRLFRDRYNADTVFGPGALVDTLNRTATAGEDGRSQLFSQIGRSTDAITYDADIAGFTVAPRFGAGDLVELLRYRASNDPAQTSELERFFSDPLPRPGNPSVGILRDNRASDLELGGRVGEMNDEQTPRPEAMAQFAIDPRQRLTTVSGARPIRPEEFDSADRAIEDGSLADSILEFQSGDVQGVFARVAGALAPSPFWPSNAAIFAQERTRNYGYTSPELAVRLAAHLAVNLADATDDDDNHEPTVRTLALETSADALPLPANTPWAWPKLTNPRLATNSADVTSPFVNVYGIEAQPFINEVGAFWVFTDAPAAAGGDEEWTEDTSDPLNPVLVQGPATLDLSPDDDSNPDYLMQGVVVQISNPFGEEINLSTADGTGAEGDTLADPQAFGYYLEVGGEYFKLIDLAAWSVDEQRVVEIDAYTSRNVVLLTENPFEGGPIHTRLGDIEAAYTETGGQVEDVVPGMEFTGTGYALSWIISQFSISEPLGGARVPPIIAVPFEPTSGTVNFPSDSGGIAGLDSVTEVRLWRALSGDADPDLASNLIENDYLADRFRIPTGNSLDRHARAVAANATLTFGPSGPDPSDPSYDDTQVGDNTGLTLVLWTRIARAYAPLGPGEIPLYALESATDTGPISKTVEDSPDGSDRPDFNTQPGWAEIWGEFLCSGSEARFIDCGGGAIVEVAMRDFEQDAEQKSAGAGAFPTNLSGEAGGTLRVEYQPRNAAFDEDIDGLNPAERPKARLLDALYATPAVGAWQELTSGGTGIWTTLGESLAIALDYDRRTTPPGSVMNELGRHDGDTAPIRRSLERGLLVLDDYVPFVDGNTDGFFDPTDLDDQRSGLGIPLALTLTHELTMMPDEWFGPVRVLPGLINVNTAPHMVLRQVPMLAPTPVSTSAGAGFTDSPSEWWLDAANLHDARHDVAAGIVAYRDRSIVGAVTSIGGAPALDFTPDGAPGRRAATTGVPGLRDGEGFRSLGELLLVRDASAPVPGPHFFSADRLARDGTNTADVVTDPSTLIAIEGRAYRDGGGSFNQTDTLTDERDEELAVISAAAQSLTVRSDLFAVWFVIRGYSEADVTGLADEEPMIPTVNRRFVMVVDRSSVTRPGQMPRVLAFEELPASPVAGAGR